MTDATNSVALQGFASGTRTGPAVMRLLLPARTFSVFAGTVNSGAFGAYTLASTASNAASVTNCENWHLAIPNNLAGVVTTSDWGLVGPPAWYWDKYWILVRAGQTVTITLESTAFDAGLWLYNSNQTEIGGDDNSGGGTNAQSVFTPTVGGFFMFEAGPVNPPATGAYTLRVH